MKKVLLAILSLCLIAASIFGLFSGVAGMKDVLNIKDYKEADQESGLAAINDQLKPGIQQLSENYDTYMEGVDTFEAGKAAYADGQAQLAAGEAQLADGYRQYNEGKQLIADNTQAYNEGKQKIAMLESYMPLIEGIAGAAQNVRNFNASLPVVGETIDTVGGQLRAAVMNLLANSAAVSAISDMVGMDVGGLLASNPTDTSICGNVVAMYYDGLAQLKQYEDGLAALADAEVQLADGERQLAEGRAQLADGAQQLADGEKQLAQFEEGQVTLAVGLCRLLSQPSYVNNYVGQVYPADEVPEPIFQSLVGNIEESDKDAVRNAIYPGFWDTYEQSEWGFPVAEGEGDEVCPSVLSILRQDDYLGANFNPATDLFMQENGGIMVRNGYPVVNLYVADKIADAGLAYINEYQGAAVMNEVIGKVVSYALMLLASVAGLLAGLFGIFALFGKGAGAAAVFGCISAISAIAAVVWTFIKGGFKGYAFGVTTGAENPWGHIIGDITGKQQLKAMVILAVVALLFWIVAHMVKKAAKKAKKAVKAQAYAAAAPVAQPVYTAPAQPAQPVYAAPAAPVAPAAPAVSAADAAAAAQKAAEEAKAAVAAGDLAAAQKAAAAAQAAADAAAKAAAAE